MSAFSSVSLPTVQYRHQCGYEHNDNFTLLLPDCVRTLTGVSLYQFLINDSKSPNNIPVRPGEIQHELRLSYIHKVLFVHIYGQFTQTKQHVTKACSAAAYFASVILVTVKCKIYDCSATTHSGLPVNRLTNEVRLDIGNTHV